MISIAEQPTTSRWATLAEQAINLEPISDEDAMAVLEASDAEVLSILHEAFRVRRHFFGKVIKLNMLLNAKSGHCPEDCGYCSQSSVSDAEVETYNIMDKETILAAARRAVAAKASTFCLVCSGRGPNPRTLDTVIEAVKEIKAEMPLRLCACLGVLAEEQAEALKEAGVDRYNHNLNTSKENYEKVCSTHTFDDRVDTVNKARGAGMSACSGVIIGMGESHGEIIDMARNLRDIGAESIPINLLHPVEGTPMGHYPEVPPMFALRVLSLFRFICPDREIRVAGGREASLRSLQPLAFFVANSLFVGDYLTTDGQTIDADHQMIKDLGFEIEEIAKP